MAVDLDRVSKANASHAIRFQVQCQYEIPVRGLGKKLIEYYDSVNWFTQRASIAGDIHSGTIYILCSVVGSHWPSEITYKSHAMPLALWFLTDLMYTF